MMPEARSTKNPLKSSLVSQFFHRIKVEMYIYPASVIPSQLQRSITFARKIFFRVSSLLKFGKNLDQTAMDTLNVRKSSQRLIIDWQTNLFPESPRVLFVETVQGPLFLSTNQNYYCTCLQNLKGAIHSTQISGNSGAESNGTVIFEKFVSIILGNLWRLSFFCSLGHTISSDAQRQFLQL